MPTTLSFDSVSFADRLKAAQVPQAQIQVEVETLREAFDVRDKDAQVQAATLHALQDAVQKLQQAQVRRDAEYATTREGTLDLGYQVKALEENARRDASERASKVDVEGVRAELREVRVELKGDIALVRKETELGFAKIDAKMDLLRKDVEAMENRMVIKLGGLIVVVAGLMLAFLRMFPAATA